MRILAIRGQNLASLARSFAIDFAAGPLRDVGLFAITGPVGAGKSTLLDALCLALFDRTPRLSNRGGMPVGDDVAQRDEWLRANDPRTLLRRDATEGHAEVDFTGRDGVRYRSRWSVRRARRRADGRVQDQEMVLRDLDHDVVVASGRKTDVLAAIEARLGLDFGQFCRSVLLAQGEFAAFLRASADERAKLLENLTGSDVYRRLSKGAHERRKALEAQVALLRSQIEAQPLLDDPTRTELETTATRLATEAEVCALGVDIAQKYVSWHAIAATRALEESDAIVHLQRAQEADAAAEPRRRVTQQLVRALAVVAHRDVAAARASERATADAAVAIAGAAVQGAEQDLANARATFAGALAAFAGAAANPPVVREFPRWEPLLDEHAATVAKLANAASAAAQFVVREARAAADVGAAHAAQTTAEAVRVAAVAAAEAARGAVAACDGTALRARRRTMVARRDELRRVIEVANAIVAGTTAASDAATVAANAIAARARRAARGADVAAARDEAMRSLQAAQAAHERARAEAGLAGQRAKLVPGEPCPLCGAREHAPGELHGADALVAAERALAVAQRGLDAAQRAAITHDGDMAHAERDVAAAETAAASATAAKARAVAEWGRIAAGEPGLATAGDDAAAIEAAVQAAVARLDGIAQVIERDEDALVAATQAFDDAAKAASGATAKAEAAARAATAAVAAHRLAAEALGEQRTIVRELESTLATQRRVLARAFAGVDAWQAMLARPDGAMLTELRHLHRLDDAVVRAEARTAEMRARHTKLLADASRATEQEGAARAALEHAAAAAAVTIDAIEVAARLGRQAIEADVTALAALAAEVERWRAVLRERTDQRKKHEAHDRPELDAADAKQALEDARRSRDAVERQRLDVAATLRADDSVRRQRDEIAPRLVAAERDLRTWAALDDLIGSSTGDAFVVFAQGLTLDLLLIEANRRLAELARRYRLEKNPSGEMDFVVVDLDLGGTRRGLQTLSGGETFLVSLALALALATLAAPRARVETLLLDEGFGTLDSQHLEAALGALDTLQASGCQVGIISHVEGIAERIGAVVEVRPEGGGQSRVLCRAR